MGLQLSGLLLLFDHVCELCRREKDKSRRYVKVHDNTLEIATFGSYPEHLL